MQLLKSIAGLLKSMVGIVRSAGGETKSGGPADMLRSGMPRSGSEPESPPHAVASKKGIVTAHSLEIAVVIFNPHRF
jgi:hypothetical protein